MTAHERTIWGSAQADIVRSVAADFERDGYHGTARTILAALARIGQLERADEMAATLRTERDQNAALGREWRQKAEDLARAVRTFEADMWDVVNALESRGDPLANKLGDAGLVLEAAANVVDPPVHSRLIEIPRVPR